MRTKGLSPLPMQLNTYEKITKDTELIRIKEGKYQKLYTFIPAGKKTIGPAIGTIYEKEHTNPQKSDLPRKKWLGKLGKIGEATYSSFYKIFHLPEKIKTEKDLNVTSLLEYVANNIYRVLGDGYFETSKVRLSRLSLTNEYLKDHLIVQEFIKKSNIKESLRVMSKWVPGYHDLGELKVKDGKNIISFMDFIKKYKRPPELVIEPKSKQEIKLKGIMGVLAAATSLADIDVLSLGGKNTGFIMEKDEENKIIRARVIKIDPGYAFNYKKVNNQRLENSKDIVVDKTHNIIIEWKGLTKEQKEEFLEVKRHNLEIIKDKKIVKYLFFREGRFNQSNTEKMPESVAKQFEDEFINHIKAQGIIYEEDLKEYESKREEIFKKVGDEEFNNRDYDRALLNYEKDFEIKMKKYGEKDVEVGKSYNSIAKTEIKRSNYPRAEQCFLKSLEIYKKTLPENSPEIAESYNNLGAAYYGKNDYDKAIEYYEKSLEIRVKTLPANHPDIAGSYGNLGAAYYGKNDYDKAIEYYKKSLEIRVKTLAANIATSHGNWRNSIYVNNEYDNDEYDNAIIYYSDNNEYDDENRLTSLSIATSCSCNSLGTAYAGKADYDKAIEYYDKSLEIRVKTLPANHPDMVTSNMNLGIAYQKLGNTHFCNNDYDKAIEYYEKSLEINEKTLPANHPSIATSYNNLGLAYSRKGDHDKAIDCFEKSLKIKEKTATDHLSLAKSYNNLGATYAVKDNDDKAYDEAIKYFEQSLEIKKKHLPPNDQSIATSYDNLGNIHRKKGEYDTALKYYKMSLEIMKQHYSPETQIIKVLQDKITEIEQKKPKHTKCVLL